MRSRVLTQAASASNVEGCTSRSHQGPLVHDGTGGSFKSLLLVRRAVTGRLLDTITVRLQTRRGRGECCSGRAMQRWLWRRW